MARVIVPRSAYRPNVSPMCDGCVLGTQGRVIEPTFALPALWAQRDGVHVNQWAKPKVPGGSEPDHARGSGVETRLEGIGVYVR